MILGGGGGAAKRSGNQTQAPSSKPTSLEQALSKEALERVDHLDIDPHDHDALAGIDHWQDIRLKKSYAKWLLILVAAQLVVADAVFVVYAWAGKAWELEAAVIQVWLGATLVELVGVVLVVTQYLFPKRNGRSTEA